MFVFFKEYSGFGVMFFFCTYNVTGSSGLDGNVEIAAGVRRRDVPGDLPRSSTWKFLRLVSIRKRL